MGNVTDRKFAVITGASSGIGRELAKECVDHGFDVLMCADDTAIHNVAAKIDPRAIAVQADLSRPEGIAQLMDAIRNAGRPVDALLLNAGVGVGGKFVDTDLDAELRMIALNCGHTVHLAKLIVPAMVMRGAGRVLITGSVVSTSPAPYQAVYGTTKAFVMSFAEALRVEVADTGVTVTTLQPGATDTDFFARADMLDTKVGQAEKDDPKLVAKRGFEAMMAGKDAVLGGGFKSRMQGLANEILPETFKAKQVAKTSEPGSGKH
jgi:short-subunit dehydrogenase